MCITTFSSLFELFRSLFWKGWVARGSGGDFGGLVGAFGWLREVLLLVMVGLVVVVLKYCLKLSENRAQQTQSHAAQSFETQSKILIVSIKETKPYHSQDQFSSRTINIKNGLHALIEILISNSDCSSLKILHSILVLPIRVTASLVMFVVSSFQFISFSLLFDPFLLNCSFLQFAALHVATRRCDTSVTFFRLHPCALDHLFFPFFSHYHSPPLDSVNSAHSIKLHSASPFPLLSSYLISLYLDLTFYMAPISTNITLVATSMIISPIFLLFFLVAPLDRIIHLFLEKMVYLLTSKTPLLQVLYLPSPSFLPFTNSTQANQLLLPIKPLKATLTPCQTLSWFFSLKSPFPLFWVSQLGDYPQPPHLVYPPVSNLQTQSLHWLSFEPNAAQKHALFDQTSTYPF
ncbi:hypothetical protein VP01_3624g1 [Puccinia sorghi]|uniref:Uncharacterized protein n=1 Tax=Puccinia sorghi TaxID=27349 RepID=A0A0L6UUX6_9BASI|nr:hypothetical protein VP01_3624g1 [Puccinia sorghi]